MIPRLLLLGATGDLAGRFLLPALARLAAAGALPAGLRVLGAGPQDWDDATFRDAVSARLVQHAPGLPAAARQQFLGTLGYRQVDLGTPATVTAAVRAVGGDTGPVAVYLALPPTLFPAAIRGLAAPGLPPGSRLAVEKPFGADLAGAQALNALLAEIAGPAEETAFRVDHALGMPRVQGLLELRGPGGALAGVWHGRAIRQLDVLWEETLGLEGRAEFYDRTGTVRDVLQNHMLQVLTLATMELPATTTEQELHAAKLALLRSLRVVAPLTEGSRRARYTAGVLGGGAAVPDYAQERGVDPARGTETYAELVLEVDTPRWSGTRFVLRAGKGLDRDRKGVALHFRGAAPAGDLPGTGRPAADQLWLELNDVRGPDGVAEVPGELAAYQRVLTDVLSGGSRTSVSAAEAEESWRVVAPVLDGWAAGAVPLLEYAAGSAGPGLLGG